MLHKWTSLKIIYHFVLSKVLPIIFPSNNILKISMQVYILTTPPLFINAGEKTLLHPSSTQTLPHMANQHTNNFKVQNEKPTSSTLIADELYFRIFVTAAMAFSVGLRFASLLESLSWIT